MRFLDSLRSLEMDIFLVCQQSEKVQALSRFLIIEIFLFLNISYFYFLEFFIILFGINIKKVHTGTFLSYFSR